MIPVSVASGKKTKERIGKVVSNNMTKTVVVQVNRQFQHPQFKKTITKHKKYYAHDEDEIANVGDLVKIQETRPLSKLKRWRLREILNLDGSVRSLL